MAPRWDVTKAARFLYEYKFLILVLYVGVLVWSAVFSAAVADYLDTSYWNSRGVWLGNGDIQVFGFTVEYMFEGYGDYSFYYVHWGHNMLRGVMPYNSDFGYLRMNGITNENGLFVFPPLTAVLYAIGVLIAPDNTGIGLLLVIMGFITVFPVYGIAKNLSNNRHVGEAAALTYLLNPAVLYHTVFAWLNPAPFILFFFLGFYALTVGRRHTGTLLIVTAALFKQTAWLLGIPLIVFLLVKERVPGHSTGHQAQGDSDKAPLSVEPDNVKRPQRGIDLVKAGFLRPSKYLDIRGFVTSCAVVLGFVGAIVFPFYIAQPQMLYHLSLASGGFWIESLTELPDYSSPIRLQHLPVLVGLPDLAAGLNYIVYYGFLLTFTLAVSFGLMMFIDKDMTRRRYYFRHLLFFTMMMILLVNITGPRGIYKYYLTLLAPFFSIFSSVKMVTSQEEHIPFSFSMLWMPIALTLLYLVPNRNVYFVSLILIAAAYALARQIGVLWAAITTPARRLSAQTRKLLRPMLSHYLIVRANIHRALYGSFQEATDNNDVCA
ncbi:MAG: hypothetical protein HXY34_03080 [Candidatus Thorarchaeota archaeon]|nr:hypothetical protein [Candidatus Thorarchaeota archaeon]